MRVGIFSDLHLHSFKPFSKPVKGGINTRSENTLEILIKVAQVAYNEYLDLVCFCGDFWHARGYLSVPLFKEAYKLVGEIPCDVVMIRGQHDLATREFGAPSGVDVFGYIDGVTVLDGEHSWKHKDLIVYGCNSDETLDDIELEDDIYYSDSAKILLMHTIIQGCKINPTFKAEEGMSLKKLHKFMNDADISKCFLGDIHLRQQMSKRVHYVGCAIQQNFGEEGYETGMTIWEPDVTMKFIPFTGAEFITMQPAPMTAFLNGHVRLQGKWYSEDNYYRVYTKSEASFRTLLRDPKWNVRLIPPAKTFSKKRSSIKLETDHKSAIRTYAKSKITHKGKLGRLTKLGIEIMESVT